MSWKNKSEFYRLEDRVLFEAGAVIQAAEAEAADSAAAEDASAESGEAESGGDAEQDAEMNEDLAAVLAPAENIKLDYAANEAAEEAEEVPVTVDAAAEGAKYTISTPRELLVINSSVADKDAILAERKPNQDVLILENGGDALEQINDYLDANAADGKYSAIHFVTHGGEGFITLAGEVMQAENTDTAAWAEIGEHLTEDGDLMFYGCDTAATAEGQALLHKIAGAAGADVAASTDTTGISGDWDLEFSVGDIETENLSVENYNHDLATFAVINTNAEGEGSLAWAVAQANSSSGADVITVDASLKDQVINIAGEIKITGVLTIEGNGVIIDGGNTFTDGVSNKDGHRIFYVNSNTTIDGVTFQNAYIANNGGAIHVNSGILTVTNSVFRNNYANSGGAIFMAHPSNNVLRISGTEFIQNTVTGDGGAIYANFSSQEITMDDVSFSGNTAMSTGGAIYAKSGVVKFSNMTFTGNEAKSGGALWYGNNGNGILTMSGENTFADNKATGSGGAIYYCKGRINANPETPNQITIGGATTFTGNSAGSGGAIYVDGGSKQLNTLIVKGDTLFEYNTASKGGAVYIGGGTTLFTDTTFANNGIEVADGTETVTTGDGGAVYINGGLENTFTNVTFDSNAVKTNGGALYIAKASVNNFNDVTFTENRAVNAGTVHGGAAYITNGTNTFTGAVFQGNSVENTTYDASSNLNGASSGVTGGGAAYISGGTNIFADSVFDGNDAGYARGGAVQQDAGISTFTGTSFTANSAAVGGAFSLNGSSTLNIADSIFEKNIVSKTFGSSSGGGSAFISINTSTPAITIERSTFTENTGDVLVFNKSQALITDSTIVGNAGSAIVAGTVSTHTPVVSVVHSTIAGNTETAAIRTSGKATVNLVNSIVVGDVDGTVQGITGGGTFNILNSIYSAYRATGTVTAASSQEVLSYADVFGTNTLQYMHSTQKLLLPGNLQVTAAEMQYLRDADGNLAGVQVGDDIYGTRSDYSGTTAEARELDVRGITVTAGTIGSVDLSSLYVAWTGSAEEDADGNQYFATIKDALAATAAGGTIYLAEGGIMVTETITVDKNITLIGQGADKTFIDGDGQYSIMNLAAKTTVTIDGITFQNGYSTTNAVGGAITTAAAALTIQNSAFVDNSVIAKHGGAIYSSTGKITIDNTDFLRNYAIQEGGAILYNGAGLTITDSRFIGNSTNDGVTNKNSRSTGGAIYANGTVTATNTLFAGNKVKGNGGALQGMTVNLYSCIFDGNTAGDQGGAVSTKNLVCIDSTFMNNSGNRGGAVTGGGGTLTFVNTTFTGNKAANYGGVFYAYGTGNFINCTIVGNSAKYGGFAAQDQHAGIASTLNVLNSLVLDNTASSGGSMFYAYDHSKETNTRTINIANTVYNGDIAENTAGAIDTLNIDTFSTDNADKYTAADLLKEPETTADGQMVFKPQGGTVAALNGVYIWHDAAWSNVAYSATEDGTKTVFLGAEASATVLQDKDQTGSGYTVRTIGSASTLEVPSLTVTTAHNVVDEQDGQISFLEALAYAQAGITAADGSSTITFADDVNEIKLDGEYTISAASGKEIVIDGGSHVTITAGKNVRLFNITAAADLTFRDITLKANGNVNGDGGMFLVSGADTSLDFDGVTVDGGGTKSAMNARHGGMIYSTVITHVAISNSSISNFYISQNGGLVYLNKAGSTLAVADSTLQSIKGNDWGGVFCLWNTDFTLDNLYVEDVQCGNRGAVLYTNNSTGVIQNSTFSNLYMNAANYGIINQLGGKVYVINSTFADARFDGFRIESGEFYLVDSTVLNVGSQMFIGLGGAAKVYSVNSILLQTEGSTGSFASGTTAGITAIGSILSGSATFNANSYGNYDGTVSSIFGADAALDADTHTIAVQTGSIATLTGVQTAWDPATGKVYYYNTDKGAWYDVSTTPGDGNKIADSAVSNYIITADQLGNDRYADTDADGSRKFFTVGAVTADEPAAGELPENMQKSFTDTHYLDGVWYVDTIGTEDSVENINSYDGYLSFREALSYAASGDTIKFSTDVFGEGNSTITLDETLQHWVIGKNLTVDGQLSDTLNITMTVKEAGVTASRLFYVNAGVEATLQNLTLHGGDISGKADVSQSDTSKNVNNGGGVIFASSATLSLDSVTMDGGKGKNGGLICVFDPNHGTAGQLYITDSTLKNGTATEFGGLISATPDMYNSGMVIEIVNSTLENGSAKNGGAIAYNHDKNAAGPYTNQGKIHSITVKGSTFSGNHLTDAAGEGAAIAVWAGSSTDKAAMVLVNIGADADGNQTVFTGNYDAASVLDINGQVEATLNGVSFDSNNVTETGAAKGTLTSLISIADMTNTYAQMIGKNEVFNGLSLTGNNVSGSLIESSADALLLGNSLVAENTATGIASATKEYYLSNTIVANTFTFAAVDGTAVNNILIGNKGGDTAMDCTLQYNLIGTAGTDDDKGNLYGVTLKDVYGTDSDVDYAKPDAAGYAVTNGILTGYTAGSAGAYTIYTSGDGSTWTALDGTAGTPGAALDTDLAGAERGTWGVAGAYQAGGASLTLSNDYRTVTGENLTLDVENLERKAGDAWISCTVRGWRVAADLTVEGATLEIVSGASITTENLSYEKLAIINNGTLTVTDTLTLNGITNNGTLTFNTLEAETADLDNAGSKVSITGETINALTYQDLTVTGNASLAGDVTVNGSFSMKGTADAILTLDGGNHTLTLSDAAKGTAETPADIQFTDLSDLTFGGSTSAILDSGNVLNNVTNALIVIAASEVSVNGVSLTYGQKLSEAEGTTATITTKRGTKIENLAYSFNEPDTVPAKAGEYGITLTEKDPYLMPEELTASVSVNKAVLTLKFNESAFTKTYDGTDVYTWNADAYTLTGLQNNDTVTLNCGSALFNADTVKAESVTLKGFTLEGENADKYEVRLEDKTLVDAAFQQTVKGSITAKALTVFIGDQAGVLAGDSVTYGTGITFTGTDQQAALAAGDQIATCTVTTDKGVSSGGYYLVGTHTVSAAVTVMSGDVDVTDCYTITYDGVKSFDVTQRQVTVSFTDPLTKVYDGTDVYTMTADGSEYKLNNVMDGETLKLTVGSALYNTALAAQDGTTVKFTGMALTGDEAANYILVDADGNEMTELSGVAGAISRREITFTVKALGGGSGAGDSAEAGDGFELQDGGHVRYGVVLEVFGYFAENLPEGDKGDFDITTDTGFSASGYYAAGLHTVSAKVTILSGDVDVTDCYTVKYEGVKTFTVDKLSITVSAGNATCEVGDATPIVSAEITGDPPAEGETINVVVTGGSTASSGTYTLTPVVTILSDENGEDVAMNYNITILDGKLAVISTPVVGGIGFGDLSQYTTSSQTITVDRTSEDVSVSMFIGSTSHQELRDIGRFFSVDSNGAVYDRNCTAYPGESQLFQVKCESVEMKPSFLGRQDDAFAGLVVDFDVHSQWRDQLMTYTYRDSDLREIGDDVSLDLQEIADDTEQLLPAGSDDTVGRGVGVQRDVHVHQGRLLHCADAYNSVPQVPVSSQLSVSGGDAVTVIPREVLESMSANDQEKSVADLEIRQVEGTLSAKAFERTASADPETAGLALAEEPLLLHRASACQDELDELLEAFLAV